MSGTRRLRSLLTPLGFRPSRRLCRRGLTEHGGFCEQKRPDGEAGAQVPTFVSLCSTRCYERRNQRDAKCWFRRYDLVRERRTNTSPADSAPFFWETWSVTSKLR